MSRKESFTLGPFGVCNVCNPYIPISGVTCSTYTPSHKNLSLIKKLLTTTTTNKKCYLPICSSFYIYLSQVWERIERYIYKRDEFSKIF